MCSLEDGRWNESALISNRTRFDETIICELKESGMTWSPSEVISQFDPESLKLCFLIDPISYRALHNKQRRHHYY